jgi:hypothetical protein
MRGAPAETAPSVDGQLGVLPRMQPANAVDPGVPGRFDTVEGEYDLPDVTIPGLTAPVEMRSLVIGLHLVSAQLQGGVAWRCESEGSVEAFAARGGVEVDHADRGVVGEPSEESAQAVSGVAASAGVGHGADVEDVAAQACWIAGTWRVPVAQAGGVADDAVIGVFDHECGEHLRVVQ